MVLFKHIWFRCYSTILKNIKKSVLISQSTDIYTNLALEDWFYKNFDFTNHHILMLWQSDPCVVIGRYQNPWLEANVSSEVKLARRYSGGGTVYHDRGNLNLTFFTSKENYNRKSNLEIIKSALYKKYKVCVEISKREDLMIGDNYKVSGTASKLGRPNAYHHCTLLINTDKDNLKNALLKKNFDIVTTASRSIPSPIKNLIEVNPSINIDQLMTAIGLEFLNDGNSRGPTNFQLITPTDEWFPGISTTRDQLASWDWCYGKSPKFTVNHTINNIQLAIDVVDGCVREIKIGGVEINLSVNNCKFSEDILVEIETAVNTNKTVCEKDELKQ